MMGTPESIDTSARSTADQIHWRHVLMDLMAGKLERLSAYIRQEDGKIDRAVALRLALMLDGNSNETEFCLTVKRHPELKSAQKGPHARMLAVHQQRKIGNFIAKYIMAHGGQREAAFVAAAEEFGLSRATIITAWKRTQEISMMREAAQATLRKRRV